jgi:hypothetical protein
MFKKIVCMLTTLALLNGQVFAKTKHLELELKLDNLITKVSDGISKEQLMNQAKDISKTANEKNMDKRDLVKVLSDKLDLDLTDQEIDETLEDVAHDSSAETIDDLAQSISDGTQGDRLLIALVLLLFVLMVNSASW